MRLVFKSQRMHLLSTVVLLCLWVFVWLLTGILLPFEMHTHATPFLVVCFARILGGRRTLV